MGISENEREIIEAKREKRNDKAACLYLQKIYNRVNEITSRSSCLNCCSSVDRRIMHVDFYEWYDALILQDLKNRGTYISLS